MIGNIGEWSEFYAFLRVLTDRKLIAADAQLNAMPEKFSDVKQISREDKLTDRKIYDIREPNEIRILNQNGILLRSIQTNSLKSSVAKILEKMKSASATTFSVPGVDILAESLACKSLKASSRSKSDLFLVIHDRLSPADVELGFSIKSMMGSPATLLNAGQATNFIYEIMKQPKNIPEGVADRVRDRVQSIEKIAGKLSFVGMVNANFRGNLNKIDSVFPEILAEIVRAFYARQGNTVKELCESIDFDAIGRTKNIEINRENAVYKVKQFLLAVALGMTPSQHWSGDTQAQGGYIVVKEDGELVCYHLYNRDEFQDYLYLNTKLETPSTTRHKFGAPYTEDGKRLIKLNLQVRFIK